MYIRVCFINDKVTKFHANTDYMLTFVFLEKKTYFTSDAQNGPSLRYTELSLLPDMQKACCKAGLFFRWWKSLNMMLSVGFLFKSFWKSFHTFPKLKLRTYDAFLTWALGFCVMNCSTLWMSRAWVGGDPPTDAGLMQPSYWIFWLTYQMLFRKELYSCFAGGT